jgi:hypothetical protein
MVEQFLSDNSMDILFKSASDIKWVVYNKLHVGDYSKVHWDKVSDVIALQVNSQEKFHGYKNIHMSTDAQMGSRQIGTRTSP